MQPDPRRTGAWIRIPLIGDSEGVVVLLPDGPVSEENWQHFMRCLEAMKPGLVEQPPSTPDQRGPSKE